MPATAPAADDTSAATATDTPNAQHTYPSTAAAAAASAAADPPTPAAGAAVNPTGRRRPMALQPTRQGIPTHLVLTMSLSTFCALDNLPTHLAGHGAMTADWARTIAATAKAVTLLILDPHTGQPLGITDKKYRPTQRVRDQVTTLNDTCSWLGCQQPSHTTDLDHITPYNHHDPDRGGHTNTHDLRTNCRWHHLLKTHTDWNYTTHPNRGLTYTSPTQHTYHQPPDAHTLPDEWLTHLNDTTRAHTTLADTEHRHTLAAPTWQPPPTTIGDHIRAYLNTKKQHTPNLEKLAQQPLTTTETLNAIKPIHQNNNNDPAPF